MTDVDSGTETKFNISASTEFVGATQALVSLTPTKSGTAAFLAVADTETIPSATAAEALLAYREINFSGTSAQIIQFALSISATQNATTGEVSGGTGAVLQPNTAYKIVMYSNGNRTILLSFTTLGNINERYPFVIGNTRLTFDMSAHNFQTGTDGKFQVPFVFSWVTNPLILQIGHLTEAGFQDFVIGDVNSGRNTSITSTYNAYANGFGNSDRGGIFLHTPLNNTIQKYRIVLTSDLGDNLTIIYN
ncbi:hypothetical protein P0082_08575 [Candidatus Haliotispira prima]|uniref:Uncharacterized protein n=1 Tax=Candidatus Haliotispira prima TaxID=3034016 RepID=A0ABY8MF98_9SPIO|nr:hypothetical protein P0082_08575 [Candidatus Haliotispira prima]